MSLFGPADRNLPFLTHAYQVNPDDLAEVRELAHIICEDMERTSRARVSVGLKSEYWFFPDAEDIDMLSEAELLLLAKACRLIQRLMTSLQDETNSGIEPDDEKELNQLCDQYPFRASIKAQIKQYPDEKAEGQRIPAARLCVRYTSEEDDLIVYLMSYVEHLILGMILTIEKREKEKQEGKPIQPFLRKCEECGSIYEVRMQKDVLLYCSHRCGTRAGMRKRRQEKKAARFIAA